MIDGKIILDEFMRFYLDAVEEKKFAYVHGLRKIVERYESDAALFLCDQDHAIPDLWRVFDEIANFDSDSQIVFDIPGNVCWDFFASRLLKMYGWSGDPQTLQPDNAQGIEQRNDVRRWLLRHLKAEQFFELEEIASLQSFSSGGEAIFLRRVWPRVQAWLSSVSASNMLDAGCGAGYASFALATDPRVASIHAFDSSAVRHARLNALKMYMSSHPENIFRALDKSYEVGASSGIRDMHLTVNWSRLHVDKVRTRRGDLGCLPSNLDGTLDGIVCVDVLEHVFDPHATVRAFARALKPGGYIFLTVPTVYCGLEERLYALTHGQLFPSLLHLNHFSESSLEDLFEREGLRMVDSEVFNMPAADTLCGPEGNLVEVLGVLEAVLRVPGDGWCARHLYASFMKAA